MSEPSEQPIGRRERKKAQTRTAISEAARRLFVERGYDGVGIRDVAEAADVAVTTLFKHFPDGKDALVFDEDSVQQEALVSAVREREPGQTILAALASLMHRAIDDHPENAEFQEFRAMIYATPALTDYLRRLWMRHEDALAAAIAEETGRDVGDVAVCALARYVLETRRLVRPSADPHQALDQLFGMLRAGWNELDAPTSRVPG